MTICCVATCRSASNKREEGVIFHRFPNDRSIAKVWLYACKRKDRSGVLPRPGDTICSMHFKPEDYERDLVNELLGLPLRKKGMLKPGSIPSINLPGHHNCDEKIHSRPSPKCSREAAVIRKLDLFRNRYVLDQQYNDFSDIDTLKDGFNNVKMTNLSGFDDGIYISEINETFSVDASQAEELCITITEIKNLEEMKFESPIENKIKEEEIRPISGFYDFQNIKIEEEEIKFENFNLKMEIKEEEMEFEEEDIWPAEQVDCDGSSLYPFSDEKYQRSKKNDSLISRTSSIDTLVAAKIEIEHENVQHVGWECSKYDGNYKKKSYQCYSCECCFDTKYQLINHETTAHGRVKPFKCRECDYSCSRNCHLIRHVKSVHWRQKPFKCSKCDYSCSVNGVLMKHVKSVHWKEKPFKCLECDYSCSRNEDLRMHVKSVHRKEKPFKCAECDYSCSANGHLVRHVKSVHRKEKPFKCKKCDYSCSMNSHLVRHVECVHRKEKHFKFVA